jgi:hypothetical protein
MFSFYMKCQCKKNTNTFKMQAIFWILRTRIFGKGFICGLQSANSDLYISGQIFHSGENW